MLSDFPIERVGIDDPEYPLALRDLGKSAPGVLYFRGDLSCLESGPAVAVVGSRRLSGHGRRAGDRIVSEYFVKREGFVTVSGLALGCDTVGHLASVRCGRPSVAVMATGLDKVYPDGNRKLAENILRAGGAWVSEYPPGTGPDRSRFVARNRIQAGLSHGVFVIESGAKGGTMHTAKFAERYGRPGACLASHFLPEFVNDVDLEAVAGNRILMDRGWHGLDSERSVMEFVAEVLAWGRARRKVGGQMEIF
ncbi:hypothetical protein FUAX_54450 (plasmid) [Fulvitalea axinellae]|uniref:Smf/DprA SLOG domain-containing protein n=1 Tax=Fulvitalea axinellae TaxID=1182444 RepID=A0AAU9DAR2_9BACT|nr:hypothetical protein FUAX_54450 [Fulvitalea axinellae]